MRVAPPWRAGEGGQVRQINRGLLDVRDVKSDLSPAELAALVRTLRNRLHPRTIVWRCSIAATRNIAPAPLR